MNYTKALIYVKKYFFFIVIFLAVLILISLIVWLIGTKIKSEKASKFGLKNFILFSVIEVFILSVPVIVAFLK